MDINYPLVYHFYVNIISNFACNWREKSVQNMLSLNSNKAVRIKYQYF